MKSSCRLSSFLRWLPAALLLASVTYGADLYKPGSVVEPFTIKDQHEQSYTFHPGAARILLVSFDMSTGKKTNAWLAGQPAPFLSDHQALLINNIHGMPGVGRMFALPKMRKYPHRILLADAEGFLDRFPAVDNQLTVLRLDAAGRVEEIQHIDPAKGLPLVFARK